MTATELQRPGYAYDPGVPRRGVRRGRERGCWVYIPAEVLREAGLPLDDPPPTYRLQGRRRSAHGHTVFVNLYSDERR